MRHPYDFNILKNIFVMILAGGQGERLYPLTKDRAKPAVPFGGIYRIIDFTLSNCLNSGLRKIAVLTQYKSFSLDRHLMVGWNVFNTALDEYIETIPPQQRISHEWYRGTADAVYQNIYTLERERPEKVLILAGDHIYKMDYRDMLAYHEEKKADLTVPCTEVPIQDAKRFGVVQVDKDFRVISFDEKSSNPKPLPGKPDKAMASMGIYLFNTKTLVHRIIEDVKRESQHDFGKNIVPAMIGRNAVYAYDFKDENKKEVKYWRDIGTLDAYWEANMDLVAVDPIFNLYDKEWPIRTYQEQYPPAKTVFAETHTGGRMGVALDSIVSSGCIISGARVERSLLSPDVRIDCYSEVVDSVIMEHVRIGKNVKIRRAIIDKSVNVPDGMSIGYNIEDDAKRFTATEKGIVVVPKEMPLQ